MWVKICGIRDAVTARWVADLSPDAIGLNFYEGSPRRVDEATAKSIACELPRAVEIVGVFVDHSPAEISRICGACGISAAQLHGDYTANDVIACQTSGLNVIRVVRLGHEWPAGLSDELDQSSRVARVLVDAQVQGAFGGTGRTAPWELLASRWQPGWPPLILAGGLTPDNVGQAIDAVGPYGVDVSSGVESAPGVKDRERVGRFIESARRASPGRGPGA